MNLVSKLLSFFYTTQTKLIAAGAILVVFLGWLWNMRRIAYNRGRDDLKDQIKKDNERVIDNWKKIDSTPSSVDDALARLRRRSRESSGP